MTITYHRDIIQHSEEWHKLRIGKLTASDMKLILTPTFKAADNEKSRQHVFDIAAQRVTQFVEPQFQSFDMIRGIEDEEIAAIKYNEKYGSVERCGFVENDKWGFTIGYSPDGLIADKGLIETKSRNQTLQFKTIVECIARDKMPDEHALQVQTGLLVTERDWLDYNTYCGGLYMATVRVMPDLELQRTIVEAAEKFEKQVQEKIGIFETYKKSETARFVETERRKEEIHL